VLSLHNLLPVKHQINTDRLTRDITETSWYKPKANPAALTEVLVTIAGIISFCFRPQASNILASSSDKK
jgi:hypothetical protein